MLFIAVFTNTLMLAFTVIEAFSDLEIFLVIASKGFKLSMTKLVAFQNSSCI